MHARTGFRVAKKGDTVVTLLQNLLLRYRWCSYSVLIKKLVLSKKFETKYCMNLSAGMIDKMIKSVKLNSGLERGLNGSR